MFCIKFALHGNGIKQDFIRVRPLFLNNGKIYMKKGLDVSLTTDRLRMNIPICIAKGSWHIKNVNGMLCT